MASMDMLDEILGEAARLRPLWDELSAEIPAWHPRNEGDDDDSSGDGAGDDDAQGAAGSTGASGADDGSGDDGGGNDDGGGSGSGEPDWKAMARKHERRAKQAAKEREDLAAKLKEFEDRDKTDQEKALAKAREEAAGEVTSKYEAERRAERLELAVTRQATKGFKFGDGDDAKTVKFADPDDALAHLERAIKRGDIDGDDIFDDNGKVQTGELVAALAELLDDKPHLAAKADTPGNGRPAGDADAGRGRAANAGDSTVDEEFQKVRRHK